MTEPNGMGDSSMDYTSVEQSQTQEDTQKQPSVIQPTMSLQDPANVSQSTVTQHTHAPIPTSTPTVIPSALPAHVWPTHTMTMQPPPMDVGMAPLNIDPNLMNAFMSQYATEIHEMRQQMIMQQAPPIGLGFMGGPPGAGMMQPQMMMGRFDPQATMQMGGATANGSSAPAAAKVKKPRKPRKSKGAPDGAAVPGVDATGATPAVASALSSPVPQSDTTDSTQVKAEPIDANAASVTAAGDKADPNSTEDGPPPLNKRKRPRIRIEGMNAERKPLELAALAQIGFEPAPVTDEDLAGLAESKDLAHTDLYKQWLVKVQLVHPQLRKNSTVPPNEFTSASLVQMLSSLYACACQTVKFGQKLKALQHIINRHSTAAIQSQHRNTLRPGAPPKQPPSGPPPEGVSLQQHLYPMQFKASTSSSNASGEAGGVKNEGAGTTDSTNATGDSKSSEPTVCAQCGQTNENLLQCSACMQTVYCTYACQKAHWKVHRPECQLYQQQAKAKSDTATTSTTAMMDTASPVISIPSSSTQQQAPTTPAPTAASASLPTISAVAATSSTADASPIPVNESERVSLELQIWKDEALRLRKDKSSWDLRKAKAVAIYQLQQWQTAFESETPEEAKRKWMKRPEFESHAAALQSQTITTPTAKQLGPPEMIQLEDTPPQSPSVAGMDDVDGEAEQEDPSAAPEPFSESKETTSDVPMSHSSPADHIDENSMPALDAGYDSQQQHEEESDERPAKRQRVEDNTAADKQHEQQATPMQD